MVSFEGINPSVINHWYHIVWKGRPIRYGLYVYRGIGRYRTAISHHSPGLASEVCQSVYKKKVLIDWTVHMRVNRYHSNPVKVLLIPYDSYRMSHTVWHIPPIQNQYYRDILQSELLINSKNLNDLYSLYTCSFNVSLKSKCIRLPIYK